MPSGLTRGIMPKPKASKEPGHPAPVDTVMTGEVRKENRERLPIGIAPVVTVRVAAMASRRRLGIGLRLRARIGFGGRVVGFRRDRGPRHASGRGITGSSGRRRGTRGRRRRGVFSLGGEACGGDQQCCGEGRREMPFHMRHPNMLRWSVRHGLSSEHDLSENRFTLRANAALRVRIMLQFCRDGIRRQGPVSSRLLEHQTSACH